MKRFIAHIDMDCFYAAIEEKYNPSLKSKAVVIGSLPEQRRGVVATANYEARKFGIHSAMSIKEAYKLNPNAVFMKTNKSLYKKESQKVMKILKTFSDEFEQVSIDEAYLDISKFVKQEKEKNKNISLNEIVRIIKKEVYKQTRLTCSIGLAKSRFVAKIASDINKPVGTTIVEDVKEFLAPLKVSKIPGIGKKAHKKLKQVGIYTIKDFREYSLFKLIDLFGNNIIKYHNIAKGIDNTYIKERKEHKSLSCEETYEYDICFEDCFTRINYLSTKLYQDLGKQGFKTISIKLRFSDFETHTKDFSLKLTESRIDNIKEISYKLLKELKNKYKINKKIRLFGIKVSNLNENYFKQANLNSFISTN